jgi:hypothetical protein
MAHPLNLSDDPHVRDLWWEAGWASKMPVSSKDWLGVHDSDVEDRPRKRRALATALVSDNFRAIFELDYDPLASFTIWQRDPFEYGSRVALVVDEGKVERCWPDVEQQT